jgi:predicted N-acetyltransferase YhbS
MHTTRQLAVPDLPALAALAGDAAVQQLLALRQHPRWQADYAQVALQDGQIHGCILIKHTRLRYGAALLDCGEVSFFPNSLPTEQLRALIEACKPVLHAAGIPLLRVHGTQHQYAALDFAPCAFETQLQLPNLSAAQHQLVLAEETDREDLAAVYEATYQAITLSEVYLRQDWHNLHKIWVLREPSGRLVGYLRQGTAGIHEAAAADSGAARDLLVACAAQFPSVPRISLPPTHLVARAGLALGGQLQIRQYSPSQATMLYKLINVPGLLEQLLPQIDHNLAKSSYAGWNGMLQFEPPGEYVHILFQAGTASVISEDSLLAIPLRRMRWSGLVQLLLGFRDAADLRATNEVLVDDTALGLLHAIL